MDKSSKSLAAFGLIIVILAVGYFGVFGQWTNWNNANAALDVSKNQNEALLQAQEDVKTFLAEFERNKQQAEVAKKVLPIGDSDTAYLLGLYEKLATESGMNLKKFIFTEQPASVQEEAALQPQTIQPLDFGMELLGSYESFKEFLVKVQRSMRLTDIVRVDVSIDTENVNSNNLIFALTLRTYFQN
ncbi:MAG: type 4a pilus biogenesis protein PilO [Candidatus Doudnabacteria bacterium]|nr:type 4a pilus biogenesis protein PilO [Candidatus Doudnabacteria bacterium]